MSDEVVIESLKRAVEAAPDDVPLRLHLAGLLLDAGRGDEAIQECSAALHRDPGNTRARAVMMRAMGVDTDWAAPAGPAVQAPGPASSPAPPPSAGSAPPEQGPSRPEHLDQPSDESAETASPTSGFAPDPHLDRAPADASSTAHPVTPAESSKPASPDSFDWDAAEAGFSDGPAKMFVDGPPDDAPEDVWDIERPRLTLADVGGLTEVKERIEVGFLAPLRNPEMRRLYGKSLRGGLLLYGPPGCGKTYIARAVAGEIRASFISVGISDVLDMYIGNSEQNLHRLFEQARRSAPVVLFLDEIDGLGGKRSSRQQQWMRTIVNQLLVELDGESSNNDGVFVMGATNQPWDVDTALRRPGRFDRLLLVSPPDAPAREAIFRHHLKTRPVEGIDVRRLAARTDGLTGADIALVCESASEAAMMDGIRSGQVRMITMRDLERAASQTRPSTGDWFVAAKNVLQFADPHSTYSDLRTYMKRQRLL